MRREKAVAQKTVHFRPTVEAALRAWAEHERRTFSAVVNLLAERDPTVQLFIQKVERQVGND